MSNLQNPSPSNGSATLTMSGLPISQLESLRYKTTQIIEGIKSLQYTIEAQHMPIMPAWPDILSKYNLLLSQTHSFSMGLTSTLSASSTSANPQSSRSGPTGNILERVALHPSTPLTDAQLDGDVIPLLRNQQTTDVLRVENETVRRLAEHMGTKGSLGVLGLVGSNPAPAAHLGFGLPPGAKKPVDYEDVLRECDEVRGAHDRRVERAVRAVLMLRDRFEWRARVEVEVEEPEELEWDPRLHPQHAEDHMEEIEGEENGITGDEAGEPVTDGDIMMEGEDGSSDDEEVQALMDSAMDTQSPASPIIGILSASIGAGLDTTTVNANTLSTNEQIS